MSVQALRQMGSKIKRKWRHLLLLSERRTIMTNPNGRFGIHGGQYIPETLMNAVIELEEAYNNYKNDPEFNQGAYRTF